MKKLVLKHSRNPNQEPSRALIERNRELPITVLGGGPGYINFMDALNGRQLVEELRTATRLPAAVSFKHAPPAEAIVDLSLDETLRKVYQVDSVDELLPLASAYARTRGVDRMSSFRDFISLSDMRNADTARIIKREISDGVITLEYESETLRILKSKKNDGYNVTQIDPDYGPGALEYKQVFGTASEQGHNNLEVSRDLLGDIATENRELPDSAKIGLMVSLITLKYTQSNSVCYVKNGQAIGIDAEQQSRVHCTRLAGSKTDNQYLYQVPRVMNLPFVDSIKRAGRDSAIDVYMEDDYMDVLADGRWERAFKIKPLVFTAEEKRV